MSVEKLSDISKVLIEQCPFTQIPNEIICGIKDNDAFRLYCYLISKSRDWKVVKEYAVKQCGIGEKKAKACWSYFARCGLIEYIVEKDEKGKIIKHDVMVLIGLKFDKNVPFKAVDNSTGAKSAPLGKTHRGKNPPSGQSTRVDFAPLLNKDITNKEKETKQREGIARKKRVPLPPDFYPDERRLILLDETSKRTGKDKESILAKFKAHYKANDEERVDWHYQFEKWCLSEKKEVLGHSDKMVKNETRSNVKYWGPGHPSYDELHSFNKKVAQPERKSGDINHGSKRDQSGREYYPSDKKYLF